MDYCGASFVVSLVNMYTSENLMHILQATEAVQSRIPISGSACIYIVLFPDLFFVLRIWVVFTEYRSGRVVKHGPGKLLTSKLHFCFSTDRKRLSVQSHQHAYHAMVFHSLSEKYLWLSWVTLLVYRT